MMASGTHAPIETWLDGAAFLEGPRWHDGRLYVSDFYTHLVQAIGPDGATTVCSVPGQPSGLGFTPDGDLLISSMLDRRLLRLSEGALHEVADLSALVAAPINDMVVDAAGRAYVGNFGSDVGPEPIRPTVLVRVDADGSASVAADGLVFPNGTVISPDGRTLIIAESYAHRITAFDVGADGDLSNRRVWASFADEPSATLTDALARDVVVPDGMCLDAEGALWVGDAHGHGALRVIEGGEVVDVVDTGDLAVYAVALGGEDQRTLFMCAAPPVGHGDPSAGSDSRLLSCRVDVAGARRP